MTEKWICGKCQKDSIPEHSQRCPKRYEFDGERSFSEVIEWLGNALEIPDDAPFVIEMKARIMGMKLDLASYKARERSEI